MNEFFHMGGYAFYVWVSYALGLLVLVGNLVYPLMHHRQVLRQLASRLRREEQA